MEIRKRVDSAAPESKVRKGRCPGRARKASTTSIPLTSDRSCLEPQPWLGLTSHHANRNTKLGVVPAHTIHPSGPTEGEVVSSSVCHWLPSVPLTAFLLVSNAVHGLRRLRVKNLTSFFIY